MLRCPWEMTTLARASEEAADRRACSRKRTPSNSRTSSLARCHSASARLSVVMCPQLGHADLRHSIGHHDSCRSEHERQTSAQPRATGPLLETIETPDPARFLEQPSLLELEEVGSDSDRALIISSRLLHGAQSSNADTGLAGESEKPSCRSIAPFEHPSARATEQRAINSH